MAECPAVPILHYQPQLSIPPSQETRAGSPGSYSGAGMLCQHFPGPGGGGEGLVQDQWTWPRRQNIPSHIHSPTPSRTTGREKWEGLRDGQPLPPSSPCPLPRPQKSGLFWEGHLLFQFPSLPPRLPRVRDAERDRVEDTVRNTEGLKPKNKARDRDRETEMERDRDTDNPKRQIETDRDR